MRKKEINVLQPGENPSDVAAAEFWKWHCLFYNILRQRGIRRTNLSIMNDVEMFY